MFEDEEEEADLEATEQIEEDSEEAAMRAAAGESFEDELLEGTQEELERLWDKEKDDDVEEK
jgi:hypothetical protein